MSLDVALYDNCCSACGRRDRVFDGNITHNLVPMAKAAGLYTPVWRPEELGITKAKQVAEACLQGFGDLFANPKKYHVYDAENGWGEYDDFVRFMYSYLGACARYPDAIVEADR